MLRDRIDNNTRVRGKDAIGDKCQLAFIEMAIEAGASNIAVRDLCKRASTTPPTFYSYYDEIDDLFLEIVHDMYSHEDEFLSNAAILPDLLSTIEMWIDWYVKDFSIHIVVSGTYSLSEKTRKKFQNFAPGSITRLLGRSTNQILSFDAAKGVDKSYLFFILENTTRVLDSIILRHWAAGEDRILKDMASSQKKIVSNISRWIYASIVGERLLNENDHGS